MGIEAAVEKDGGKAREREERRWKKEREEARESDIMVVKEKGLVLKRNTKDNKNVTSLA